MIGWMLAFNAQGLLILIFPFRIEHRRDTVIDTGPLNSAKHLLQIDRFVEA